MKSKSVLSAIFGFSIASWVGALINLISIPLSSHLYEPLQLGRINYFFSMALIIFYIMLLGLDQGFIRFYSDISKDTVRKQMLTFCLCLPIIVSVFCFVVLSRYSANLSGFIFGERNDMTLLYILITVIVLIALRFFSLPFRMSGHITGYTIIAILFSLVSKGLYLLSAAIRKDAYTAIEFVCMMGLIAVVILSFVMRKELACPRFRENKEIHKAVLRFSIPLMPAMLMSVFNTYIPQIILRAKLGLEEVALFSIAVSIASVLNVIQTGFNTFWGPYVFEHYQTERDKIQKMHIWLTITITIFSMGIVLFQDLAFLFIAQAYKKARSFLPFLLTVPLCYTIGETTGIGISIAKKTKHTMLIYSLSAFVNCILCYIAVGFMGLQGAAVAAGTSAILTLAAKTYVGERYYQSIPCIRYMVVSLSMFCLLCVTNLMVQHWVWRFLLMSVQIGLTCCLFGVSEIKKIKEYLWRNIKPHDRQKGESLT